MKKLILLCALLFIALSAWSQPIYQSCKPGTKKFLGKVDFTVIEYNAQGYFLGSIREGSLPIMNSSSSIELGDHLQGSLYSHCVDIGHISGRQTYWRQYLMLEE